MPISPTTTTPVAQPKSAAREAQRTQFANARAILQAIDARNTTLGAATGALTVAQQHQLAADLAIIARGLLRLGALTLDDFTGTL